MLWCIDSLTSENFQMADPVWNRPITLCKPLVIDYVMYALIVCIVLLTWKQLFIPNLHTSIREPDICNYYLLASVRKKLAPKKSLQGPLWPSSKTFWLKHWSMCWSWNFQEQLQQVPIWRSWTWDLWITKQDQINMSRLSLSIWGNCVLLMHDQILELT